jgi:hypothetical protein
MPAIMEAKEDVGGGYGLAGSLARSFLTQYWPFTAYVLSYTTVGMALGAVTGVWDWTVVGLTLAAMWFGLEGLHAIDLAEPTIATRIDSDVQLAAGALGLGIGAALGAAVAWMTSWWFLAFVAVELFLGLAYNMEWFNGLLHDFDTPSGIANFGFSWGAVPFLVGYFVTGGGLTLGAVVVAAGVMFDAMKLIALFEVSKPEPYDDLSIEHNRDIEQDTTLMNEVTHRGNKMSMVAWALMAVGLVLMFVV